MAGNPDESSAISSLGGLALNDLIGGELEGYDSSYLQSFGLAGSNKLSKEQIENDDLFGDDDDDEQIGANVGDDFEDDMDEDLPEEEETLKGAPSQSKARGEDDDYDEDYDAIDEQPYEPEEADMEEVADKEEEAKKIDVKEIFPAFDADKVLNFTHLFSNRGQKRRKINSNRKVIQPPHIHVHFQQAPSTKELFNRPLPPTVPKPTYIDHLVSRIWNPNVQRDSKWKKEEPSGEVKDTKEMTLVDLADWEDDIKWSAGPEVPLHIKNGIPMIATLPPNSSLMDDDWTKSIIFNEKQKPQQSFVKLTLDMNDPSLMFEELDESSQQPATNALTSTSADPFNLSNDHLYEQSVTAPKHRIRQTFSQIDVQHAYPALKLQLPFYKTRLSKNEARSFHRPILMFPLNVEQRFAKVRSGKKKKDKEKRRAAKVDGGAELLHTTKDLTLKDGTNYALWEYSEEYPSIMSNFGMGSVLVNYYRKKDQHDDHVPKSDFGEPFVLDVADESPFMKLGFVDSGQTIPTLYNNLIRAPLFRHQANPTDFLVIRSTSRHETSYFIREIKNVFLVGQTYPVSAVPGPHSRMITNTTKYRLQAIAYKLLKRTKGERLILDRLWKYFQDQNEMQMRQRLKEFMEYNRKGEHAGYWRLKATAKIPENEEILKLVSPEHVALCEAMQVGQRRLLDAGYGNVEDESQDTTAGDETKLSIEQQLAPWITTKNFVNATQSKAMLKLYGEGDPSGRGEAFSFIRVSMKDIFLRAGEDPEKIRAEVDNRPKHAHRYTVAEQQKVYKEEIARIWKAQFKALSNPIAPKLDRKDEEAFASHQRAQKEADEEKEKAKSQHGTKILKIRRLINGSWQTEMIEDSAVISAYVRKRQIIEDQSLDVDKIEPTGDEELDRRRAKMIEEKINLMRRNQERRLQRKNQQLTSAGGEPLQMKTTTKSDTTRKCGNCGQIGHMKTNRKCPLWAQFHGPNAQPSPNAAAQLPTPTVAATPGIVSGLPSTIDANNVAGFGTPQNQGPTPAGGSQPGTPAGANQSKIKLNVGGNKSSTQSPQPAGMQQLPPQFLQPQQILQAQQAQQFAQQMAQQQQQQQQFPQPFPFPFPLPNQDQQQSPPS
ncbi:hypothetical protein E3Q03_02238 [Wallemia mellicola]|uniref:Transcription initiation factor TFIID subunit 1 histone acetyltransferase domain-containing protein n=1 Tax=Wallemia mellicola TaxID=1708541 RepID=A0AB74KE69_9BASI|nr:hypothetical protein E3Q03_02238 [Wallemia mellicola]